MILRHASQNVERETVGEKSARPFQLEMFCDSINVYVPAPSAMSGARDMQLLIKETYPFGNATPTREH